MVYCGKPSRGCQMCRTRRIKCDETKPTCNQCAKSRRVCPGYKDDFDLVFRNETQATERRARRAVNSKRTGSQIVLANQQSSFSISRDETNPQKSPTLIAPNPDQDMSGTVVPFGVPFVAPSIPLEQQAPCFFVSNFVIAPRQQSRGYFDFLMPMLKNESSDSHLSLAFSAVAMASLANRPNTRGQRMLFSQAIGQYAKALKATNLALQSPVNQKTDSTLAAILMLGFFEVVAMEKTNAMAWYSHVEGAVQLVEMRGKKQLKTKVGYSLFTSVRNQMLVSALTGSKPLTMGTKWWIAETDTDKISSFVTDITCRAAELRMELNNAVSTFPRTHEYYQEVTKIMRKGQALENECLDWEASLPDEWRPRTVSWVDQVPGGDITKAEVFPGKVDMYTDITIANLWNILRVARLFISGAVVRCAAWICSPVDFRTTPEYAQAVRLCADLITDVIAGTPYHLGWRVNSSGILKSGDFASPLSSDSGNGGSGIKAIGGVFMMWPLFSISNMDYISDSQRIWAKSRLLFVSETLGLNHAKVLSNYHLRLPSMIIRRDNMMHMAQSVAASAAGTRGFSPPVAANTSAQMTTNTISKIAVANGFPSPPASFINPNSFVASPNANTNINYSVSNPDNNNSNNNHISSNNSFVSNPTINTITNYMVSDTDNNGSNSYASNSSFAHNANMNLDYAVSSTDNHGNSNYIGNSSFVSNSSDNMNLDYTVSNTNNNGNDSYVSNNNNFINVSNMNGNAYTTEPAPGPSQGANTGAPNVMTTGLPTYTMNPLQQREAMLQEKWDDERKNLLKKGANSQGDSVERLLANYFVV
ncbi:hypothetical protein WAI453_007314 [Rhynchosporium graminicola]|uniref:Related to negative acting factor n=1 Tax=Rhynchosporium graminicola TaxID=2792576 RepID=A0A1E1LCP0_9HELO|nr:related to negative acting factor [Rhynchosporium commune]